MLNFLTPSSATNAWNLGDASNANYLRIFSNPKPVQSDYYVEGTQLVDFKIAFLNDIPIIWTVFGVILIREPSTTGSSSGRSRGSPRSRRTRTWRGSRRRPRRSGGRAGVTRRPPRDPPPMRILATDRAAAYIEEQGGEVWVWLDPRRGMVGSYVWLEAHCVAPRSNRRSSFTRSSRRPTGSERRTPRGSWSTTTWGGELPDELHLDLKGWRKGTRRLEAYWNGSVFAGPDIPKPGEA